MLCFCLLVCFVDFLGGWVGGWGWSALWCCLANHFHTCTLHKTCSVQGCVSYLHQLRNHASLPKQELGLKCNQNAHAFSYSGTESMQAHKHLWQHVWNTVHMYTQCTVTSEYSFTAKHYPVLPYAHPNQTHLLTYQSNMSYNAEWISPICKHYTIPNMPP